MKPDRWIKVKEIFQAALDRAPAERAAFVSEACGGDEALRKEVEALISSDGRDGTFLDAPAYEAAAKIIVNEKSNLKPRQLAGPYEIVSFISRGGMGEVYLAHDPRLHRKVALKVLPRVFTKDSERLHRFEQEARAASALNHPNIITIYEILKTGSTHVIATEFVEGETLRQRLSTSTLTLSESLHIAVQVADALTAAHKVGIIHRDIKPENIMLRPDGYVKVLDFGLAKLAEESPEIPIEEALTKQVRTGSGVVIGTAGYMSPEQARGKAVDARTDIFSLGAVIYEMVTQQKPFSGETPSDILAAILKTEPAPMSRFSAGTPAELSRIVTKALRKDREERYQVVRDLLLDLKSLKEELEFQARLDQSAAPASQTGSSATKRSATTDLSTSYERNPATMISEALSLEFKRHRAGVTLFLMLLVIVLAGGAFGLYRLLTRSHVAHFQSTSIARLTNSGKVINAHLSRDGNYLVYVLFDAGKQSLWIRNLNTANDKLIIPPAATNFFGLTFSPDGAELFYVIKNFDAGTLYRIPMLGGPPVKVLEKIDTAVTFSPDGQRFAFLRAGFPGEGQSALMVANSNGTNERTLAVRKQPDRFVPIFFTAPSWSPDGKLIAASVFTYGGSSRVIAFPVDGGNEINLSKETWTFSGQVAWLPDMSGLLLVAGSNSGNGAQVWFLSHPAGERRQITNDLDQHRAIGLTADGRRFVTVVSSGVVTVWVAPNGDASRAVNLSTGNVGLSAGAGNPVAWAPNGKIVFVSGEGNDANLWIMDADGGNRRQLTANAGRNGCPVVSPDGQYIVFSSTRSGQQNIWRMNIDGSNTRQLTRGVGESRAAISPDGQWVVYASQGSSGPTIWKVSIDGGPAVEITHRVSTNPMISPDGKSIAYLFSDSPDSMAFNRIAIMPFAGGDPHDVGSFEPATTFATVGQWSADGKSILYTATANNVTNVMSQPIAGGPPKQVTDFKDSFMTGFAWSRDGKQLVCTRGIFNRDAVLISEAK